MFLQSKSFLGIDIGTVAIKAVEISKKEAKPFLKNYGYLETYGHLERVNDAIQTSSLKPLEKETVQLLKFLIEKIKPKTKEVIASIPSFDAYITTLEFPLMGENETNQAIPFRARDYIPLPISEVSLDWLKIGEKEERGHKFQKILLVSLPVRIIENYRRIFEKSGLRLQSIELEPFALSRSLTNPKEPSSLIVDIGGYDTTISVVDKGMVKEISRTDFASSSFTSCISRGLGVQNKRAEELKKRYGLLGEGAGKEISTLMYPFLDVIIKEVKKTKEKFENSFNSPLERIILTGGGANLLGIEKYFENQSGIFTIKGNPFLNIDYPREILPIVKDLGPSLSVSIGLAVKKFIKQ